MPRHSGLQLEVIKLYKQCMQVARSKPAEHRANWERFVRAEFAKNRHISPKDFATIEYLARTGKRRLDTYRNPSIHSISF
ncbi:hypothetical protein H9P43_001402 [Blastocladiella emersonii ATCC 22665]|nr:hypothetical protein H9P43_001402 [Blastocladiella emersonii ATCC 22665]